MSTISPLLTPLKKTNHRKGRLDFASHRERSQPKCPEAPWSWMSDQRRRSGDRILINNNKMNYNTTNESQAVEGILRRLRPAHQRTKKVSFRIPRRYLYSMSDLRGFHVYFYYVKIHWHCCIHPTTHHNTCHSYHHPRRTLWAYATTSQLL